MVIYAGVNGFLDKLAVKDVTIFEHALLTTVKSAHDDILATIRRDKKVEDGIKEKLNTIIQNCLDGFLATKA